MPSVLPGRGSSWVSGADRQVAYSERRGEQKSAAEHANVVTALIKRDAHSTHRQGQGSDQRK